MLANFANIWTSQQKPAIRYITEKYKRKKALRGIELVSRGQTLYSRRALSIRNYKRPREKGLKQFTVCAGTDTFDVSIRSKAKQPCRVKKQMVIKYKWILGILAQRLKVTRLMGLIPLKPKTLFRKEIDL